MPCHETSTEFIGKIPEPVFVHLGLDDDMYLGHKYDLMLGVLEEAIGYFPKFATAYRRRGELLVAKVDDKAAVPEFTKSHST